MSMEVADGKWEDWGVPAHIRTEEHLNVSYYIIFHPIAGELSRSQIWDGSQPWIKDMIQKQGVEIFQYFYWLLKHVVERAALDSHQNETQGPQTHYLPVKKTNQFLVVKQEFYSYIFVTPGHTAM